MADKIYDDRVGDGITDLMLRADWLLLGPDSQGRFEHTAEAPGKLWRATEPTEVDGNLVVVEHKPADDRHRLTWRVALAPVTEVEEVPVSPDEKRAYIRSFVDQHQQIAVTKRMVNLGRYDTDIQELRETYVNIDDMLGGVVAQIAKLTKPNNSQRVIH